MIMRRAFPILSLLVLSCAAARAEAPTLQGEWRTNLGVVTFKPEGDELVATFAIPRIPSVKGAVKGKTATLASQGGNTQGNASLTLDDSGRSFAGWFQFGGQSRSPWNGWRLAPEATKRAAARL